MQANFSCLSTLPFKPTEEKSDNPIYFSRNTDKVVINCICTEEKE